MPSYTKEGLTVYISDPLFGMPRRQGGNPIKSSPHMGRAMELLYEQGRLTFAGHSWYCRGDDHNCVSRVVLIERLAFFVVVICVMASSSAAAAAASARLDWSSAVLIRVDQSGMGDYVKIQDAVDAVPANNKEPYFIWVKPGTYKEKVVIPANKPFITLSGSKAEATIITWNDSGDVMDSSTLAVFAPDFVARLLTIKNSFGYGTQAVALRVSGDRAAFYGCRILSYQDTLFDDEGRHYYINCYIEGSVDFICGNGLSIFEKCRIHSLLHEGEGTITAQKRGSPKENTGYVFINCRVTGSGTTVLGRPWASYSRVIFAWTYMSKAVLPHGWDDWGKANNRKTVFYGQYRCHGPGASTTKRVDWSHEFTSQGVAPFVTKSLIGGSEWLHSPPTKFRKGSTVITSLI